jgi:hypothetical protein
MQKWEINKTYQLVDYQGFVNDDYTNNNKIYNKIGYSEFKVVDSAGKVLQIVVDGDYFTANDLDLLFIFKDEDLQYFKLVDSLPENKPSSDEVVIGWLDKLHYVMRNDSSVHEQLYFNSEGLVLTTDLCDIQGSVDIYNFVDGLYGEMQSKAEIKHKKELQSKREQLLAELAEIDKQLNIK